MYLLLCSDFLHIGLNYTKHFFKEKSLTCLFISYALENDESYINANKQALKNSFNIEKFIDLTANYTFNDKIDLIFVNGGNPNLLLERLHKYNQFKKIKELVASGILYIGESAGAIIAGDYQPHNLFLNIEKDMNLIKHYGNKFYDGFRFLNNFIAPHASKLKVVKLGNEFAREFYKTKSGSNKYSRYLNGIKQLKKHKYKYTTLGNNEVLLVLNNKEIKRTYNWSKFPILEVK